MVGINSNISMITINIKGPNAPGKDKDYQIRFFKSNYLLFIRIATET